MGLDKGGLGGGGVFFQDCGQGLGCSGDCAAVTPRPAVVLTARPTVLCISDNFNGIVNGNGKDYTYITVTGLRCGSANSSGNVSIISITGNHNLYGNTSITVTLHLR